MAEERILGGQDAGFGQFPWTALIQIKGHQLDKLCAGTLVNNRCIINRGLLADNIFYSQVHIDCRALCPILQSRSSPKLQSSYSFL